MKQLVLNMVCRLETGSDGTLARLETDSYRALVGSRTDSREALVRMKSSDSDKALVGENSCEAQERLDLCITPLFLRDVGKYYWNQKTVLEDYKYLVEPVQGGYYQFGDAFSSYQRRFEHKMFAENYTRMFQFFPHYEGPNLDYDDVDPRVWIKFYVKSKGCNNLDFPPLKQACDEGKYLSVLFIIQNKAWEKDLWEAISPHHVIWHRETQSLEYIIPRGGGWYNILDFRWSFEQ